jgi:hypothetical protein
MSKFSFLQESGFWESYPDSNCYISRLYMRFRFRNFRAPSSIESLPAWVPSQGKGCVLTSVPFVYIYIEESLLHKEGVTARHYLNMSLKMLNRNNVNLALISLFFAFIDCTSSTSYDHCRNHTRFRYVFRR